jgi:MSHA biogenesis protein MshQ
MKLGYWVLIVAAAVAGHGCGDDGGGSAGTGGTAGTGGVGGLSGGGPNVPSEGLQAFLPFSADASDESGNGNDGTLLGAATASGELILGNNADDMLVLPSSVMDGLVDFTFAAWLRIDTIREESHEVISGANAAEDNALIFWYRDHTDEWVVGINNGSSVFASDSTIEDGEWHHVALTRSGAIAVLYLDGSQLGDAVDVGAESLDIDPGGLIFGQDQDEVGGGFEADEAWAGAIDNLRIYDRALDQAEVALLAAEAR